LVLSHLIARQTEVEDGGLVAADAEGPRDGLVAVGLDDQPVVSGHQEAPEFALRRRLEAELAAGHLDFGAGHGPTAGVGHNALDAAMRFAQISVENPTSNGQWNTSFRISFIKKTIASPVL